MTSPPPDRAPSSPKAQLAAHGLFPKKSFGQNFLADASLARRIAELSTTPEGGTVVELGAGLGALTRPLLDRAARVIAVERDRDLVPALRETEASAIDEGRLIVLEADAKTVDIAGAFASSPKPHVLAGNLPYQITGPLLTRAVELSVSLERAVFLVQLEVADRLAAAAGTEAYGALSVFTQARFQVRRAFVVKRGAFYPQPRVDSAVVDLVPRRPPVCDETSTFRALVKGAFGARRKKLKSAWAKVAEREQVVAAAAVVGVDLDARGETLPVEAFAAMARELEG